MLKTQEQFKSELYDKFTNNIDVVGTYVDQHTKISFHCNICDIDFETTPQSILHSTYGCKECGKKAAKLKQLCRGIKTNGRLIDKYPHIAEHWCYEKNTDIDINNISPKSGQRVWWICDKCGEPYQAKVCGIVNGTQKCICHNCYVKVFPSIKLDVILNRDGSFADNYPELLSQWSYDLNGDLDPFQFTNKSNQKVWWECTDCGHQWKTTVAHRVEGEICPYCARHTKSILQIKIEDYIRSKYSYQLLNEHRCTLRCYNPKTGYRLLYDNELVISNNIHLIIECHGQQHYEVCGWSYTQAKAENCTPEEILQYQQWKDKYKEDFAINNGFYYCVISYLDEINDKYQDIIDNKVKEILALTQQND